MKKPVIVSSVMGSTSDKVNPENASRCFVVNTDESREQTERIHEEQRKKYSLERLKDGEEKAERIIQQHHAAQRLLEKRVIVNDYAQYLDFPTSLMRMRRDHDRFLDLIACVCFVRQYQKKEETEGGFRYIRCDGEDYRIAYWIMVEGVLSSTMRELPKGSIELYEDIREWVRKTSKQQNLGVTELTFTQRQVREATGLGHTWVKATMKKLLEYEYLEISRGGMERSKSYYRLRADEAIMAVNMSMIPSPEEMQGRIRKKEVKAAQAVKPAQRKKLVKTGQ